MTGRPSRPAGIRRPRLAIIMHAARVTLVIALLMAIPAPSANSSSDGGVAPAWHQLNLSAFTGVESSWMIEPDQDANGMWRVVDGQQQLVALVARTLPAAVGVVGYRGPSEASIVFSPELQIVSVGLLDSADTEEHVSAVIEDDEFFRQFRGWPWGGPSTETEIDAVSGATLTSLALAEGVLKRIGGQRPSLVFPDPLRVDEVADWFPDAAQVDDLSAEVRNASGVLIGRVVRSGLFTDDLIGYQGPTEVLMRVGLDNQVEAIRLRHSLDNEPYVDYVRVEAGFWAIFTGQTLSQLAGFAPQEAGVEGVSGATMTSLAVADTIVAAAQGFTAASASQATPQSPWSLTQSLESMRWTRADIATIGMLALAGLLSRAGLFHVHLARRIWLLMVLVVIGLWSGNLVSMALVAGWSAEGVAWRLAPGLSSIAALSLLVPPLTKSNPYCNHLCPHGAVQQLIKPASKSRRRWKLSAAATRWLRRIPGATLAAAYLCLIAMPSIELSSWEPFHAYLFRIASWGSFVLALGSLALSTVIPMGYCRLGCPTGRLLDYLRRSAVSDRIQTSDVVAGGLLLVAIMSRWIEL